MEHLFEMRTYLSEMRLKFKSNAEGQPMAFTFKYLNSAICCCILFHFFFNVFKFGHFFFWLAKLSFSFEVQQKNLFPESLES